MCRSGFVYQGPSLVRTNSCSRSWRYASQLNSACCKKYINFRVLFTHLFVANAGAAIQPINSKFCWSKVGVKLVFCVTVWEVGKKGKKGNGVKGKFSIVRQNHIPFSLGKWKIMWFEFWLLYYTLEKFEGCHYQPKIRQILFVCFLWGVGLILY